MNIFFEKQDKAQQNLYIEMLEIVGSLSNLFAESQSPFLYYRAMENIFCKAFQANNFARSDISADAGKAGIGIGLKTFLQNNGKTFQKIAEFNRESYNFEGLDSLELVRKVSFMRNERIESTKRICNFHDMIYHLLTRSEGKMALYEEKMDLICLDNIEIIDIGKTTIHFTDGLHFYNFNRSKSTLLKRFYTEEINKVIDFPVKILDDPFEILLKSKKLEQTENCFLENQTEVIDYIILPLYSIRSGEVSEKSGLNQWNAGGRVRNLDEVYIPFPSWIHMAKPSFFKELYRTPDHKTDSFVVQLPNQEQLSMRIAQENGKALMSNPNKALGRWILREVLNLPEGELVTKSMLDVIGIDSVRLSKRRDGIYNLDFLKTGSYEQFEEQFRI